MPTRQSVDLHKTLFQQIPGYSLILCRFHAAWKVLAGGVLGLLAVGCSGGTDPAPPGSDVLETSETVITNDGPEGDSGLTAGDIRYPLNAAIGDIWGVSGDHYRVDFTLTNGNFRIESANDNDREYSRFVPDLATAVFHARMYSPGDSFYHINYSHVPSDSVNSTLSGVGFFRDAYIGLDTNGDGMVSEIEEIDVIDGLVEVAGTLLDMEMRFQVTLSNGQALSGEYTGLIDFTTR